MRILYLAQRTLPEHLTGSELCVHEMARSQLENNTVMVVAMRNAGPFDRKVRRIRENGLDITVYPGRSLGDSRYVLRYVVDRFNLDGVRRLISAPANGYYYSLLFGTQSPSLLRDLGSIPADIIHTTGVPSPVTWIAWRLAAQVHVPFVINPNLHLASSETTQPYVYRMLKDAAAVIALTQFERRYLEQHGIDPSRIHVIPDGVDLDPTLAGNGSDFRGRHGISPSAYVVLIPRKTEAKGTLHSLSAARQAAGSIPNLTVLLLGSCVPAFQRIIDHLARTLRAEGVRVFDLGYLPGREYRNAIAACDVVLEPSKVESLGRVYLEAWLELKPVIAADSGAVSEVVENEVSGLLVRFGDIPAIASALRRIHDEPATASRYGREGRRRVESRFDSKVTSKAMAWVYASILRSSPTPTNAPD